MNQTGILMTRIATELFYQEVVAEWGRWPVTKDLTEVFDFRELCKKKYGFTIAYRNAEDRKNKSFRYNIVDEEKFTWFLLGGRVK